MPALVSDVCKRTGVRMCTGLTPTNWPTPEKMFRPGVNMSTVVCCLFSKMKRPPSPGDQQQPEHAQWRQCLSQLLTSVYDGPSTTKFVCQRPSHPIPMFSLTITIAQILHWKSPESGTSLTSSSISILVFTQMIAL
jgi:hypothetical protein